MCGISYPAKNPPDKQGWFLTPTQCLGALAILVPCCGQLELTVHLFCARNNPGITRMKWAHEKELPYPD